jgi:hypothetical protein
LSCDPEIFRVPFPHLAGVRVERAFLAGRSLRIWASARAPRAACPACGQLSGRVHSRCDRRLPGTAIADQETMIVLRVRRFFCPNPGCASKTFAEQINGLTSRYGRRSPGQWRCSGSGFLPADSAWLVDALAALPGAVAAPG